MWKKWETPLLVLSFVFSAFTLSGAQPSLPVNLTFSEGQQASDIVSIPAAGKAELRKDDVKGENVNHIALFLSGDNAAFPLTRNFPVEGKKKYLLEMTAHVDGVDVVEKNSRIPEIQVMSGASLLPGWSMEFRDSAGKLLGSRSFNGMTFISEKRQTYTDVFHAPPGAVSMRLSFRMGKNSPEHLVISSIRFQESPDEGALNCNPEFRAGYSGWNYFLRGALLMHREDGKAVFDTAYGSGGELFPLDGSGTYRLFGKGSAHGGYRVINFEQRDQNGKVIKVISLTATPQGNSVDFILEKDAVMGRLNSYNHLLEEVRVIRMGDESELAKLDAARRKKK